MGHPGDKNIAAGSFACQVSSSLFHRPGNILIYREHLPRVSSGLHSSLHARSCLGSRLNKLILVQLKHCLTISWSRSYPDTQNIPEVKKHFLLGSPQVLISPVTRSFRPVDSIPIPVSQRRSIPSFRWTGDAVRMDQLHAGWLIDFERISGADMWPTIVNRAAIVWQKIMTSTTNDRIKPDRHSHLQTTAPRERCSLTPPLKRAMPHHRRQMILALFRPV